MRPLALDQKEFGGLGAAQSEPRSSKTAGAIFVIA
jgi:hypothetical protein